MISGKPQGNRHLSFSNFLSGKGGRFSHTYACMLPNLGNTHLSFSNPIWMVSERFPLVSCMNAMSAWSRVTVSIVHTCLPPYTPGHTGWFGGRGTVGK